MVFGLVTICTESTSFVETASKAFVDGLTSAKNLGTRQVGMIGVAAVSELLVDTFLQEDRVVHGEQPLHFILKSVIKSCWIFDSGREFWKEPVVEFAIARDRLE